MLCNFDDLSFRVLTIGCFSHAPGCFQVKARPHAALSFRVSGTGDFLIAGKRLSVAPGDVLFIPANAPYKVEYSVSESIVAHLSDCNYTEAEIFSPKNSASLLLAFRRLLEDWSELHSTNRAKSAIYDILFKMESDKRTAMESTAFSNCLRYIEAHLGDAALNVGEICRAGPFSASSLQRAFKLHLGISPKQYLDSLRMNRALELLAENTLPVKNIALACGFADEKYFSRAFKRKYGYPPSKWRNRRIV